MKSLGDRDALHRKADITDNTCGCRDPGGMPLVPSTTREGKGTVLQKELPPPPFPVLGAPSSPDPPLQAGLPLPERLWSFSSDVRIDSDSGWIYLFLLFPNCPHPDLTQLTQMSTHVERTCVWKASLHRILRLQKTKRHHSLPLAVLLVTFPQLPGSRQKQLRS